MKHQFLPAAASDASGNFVVVWDSGVNQDGSFWGVFGQRYDSSGAPLGPEFRVNTFTLFAQDPSVASDDAGDFVVVWRSRFLDGSGYGVLGQRFDSSGTPVGPEFRVNTYTTGDQYSPAVASDESGNFIVVWTSDDQDGSFTGVFGQRYASTGAPRGSEFRVNSQTFSAQEHAGVSSDAAGNFVVVWNYYSQTYHSWSPVGQRFASAGAPLGPNFEVTVNECGYGKR
jgi:hypothetical protein